MNNVDSRIAARDTEKAEPQTTSSHHNKGLHQRLNSLFSTLNQPWKQLCENMALATPNWLRFGITLATTVLTASTLLPLVRTQPTALHAFFNELHLPIRIAFIFALSCIFSFAAIKLFRPRIHHLVYCGTFPPMWLAFLIGWIAVALFDIHFHLSPTGYKVTTTEWLFYGAVSVLLTSLFCGVWSGPRSRKRHLTAGPRPAPMLAIASSSWNSIESWLMSDSPADSDFLDNHAVATRVAELLADGIRSIGIVGPFGAGKTSIVRWVMEHLDSTTDKNGIHFVCHQSCWGFEKSANAVHDMLASAIAEINYRVDTFQFDSLPEVYRKTFSAGGDWLEHLSQLLLRSPDTDEQFQRLSDLLGGIGGRLVFIVEDLDRANTHGFETEEVLAFLARLKAYSHISFVITGGASKTRPIDYAKLCDHIEYMPSVRPFASTLLISRLRTRCLDTTVFPYIRLHDTDEYREWDDVGGSISTKLHEPSLPQAVSLLLTTPRSLRHVLGRVFRAWHRLNGEINFDQLLALNVIRFGAPECFQFLLRQWPLVRRSREPQDATGQESNSAERSVLNSDWDETTKDVPWDPNAALRVLRFLIPTTAHWLPIKSRERASIPQSVSEERYWIRAINESVDAHNRDQEVLKDVVEWKRSPSPNSDLVVKLTTRPGYDELYESIGTLILEEELELTYSLSRDVIDRLLQIQGAFAGRNSLGFFPTCRAATAAAPVALALDNVAWLRERVTAASSVSINMVNALWRYYGVRQSRDVISSEDLATIRHHVRDTLHNQLADGRLGARLPENDSAVLLQLICDSANDEEQHLTDPREWTWLAPIILEELRRRSRTVAVNCAYLISVHTDRDETDDAYNLVTSLFGSNYVELATHLADMAVAVPGEERRILISAIRALRAFSSNEHDSHKPSSNE